MSSKIIHLKLLPDFPRTIYLIGRKMSKNLVVLCLLLQVLFHGPKVVHIAINGHGVTLFLGQASCVFLHILLCFNHYSVFCISAITHCPLLMQWCTFTIPTHQAKSDLISVTLLSNKCQWILLSNANKFFQGNTLKNVIGHVQPFVFRPLRVDLKIRNSLFEIT